MVNKPNGGEGFELAVVVEEKKNKRLTRITLANGGDTMMRSCGFLVAGTEQIVGAEYTLNVVPSHLSCSKLNK